MNTPDPKTHKKDSEAKTPEKSRLLRELFLNASLLAMMKETVEEAVELDRLERALAREEERAISAPAA